MGFALVLTLAASPAPDLEAAEVIGRLKECGFTEVATAADEYMGGQIVASIAELDADDGQLDCAARVSLETHSLVVVPELLRERYHERYRPLAEEAAAKYLTQMSADARQWFADRGQLHEVPDVIDGRFDASALKRAAIKLCGRDAEDMLTARADELTLQPPAGASYETTSCVLRLIMASGHSKSSQFGFIGNEALAQYPDGAEEEAER